MTYSELSFENVLFERQRHMWSERSLENLRFKDIAGKLCLYKYFRYRFATSHSDREKKQLLIFSGMCVQ